MGKFHLSFTDKRFESCGAVQFTFQHCFIYCQFYSSTCQAYAPILLRGGGGGGGGEGGNPRQLQRCMGTYPRICMIILPRGRGK